MGSRMFTAILPPLSVLEEIDAHLAPRRQFSDSWRWTPMAHWHLTTCFMADVSDHARFELEEGLSHVAASTPRFDLRVGGALCFPDVSRARVLALGVAQGHDELARLSQRCRQAASRAGVEADGSRFVGHLTLARANRGSDATKWARVLDSFPGWGWEAWKLVLVESHLEQRRHEVAGEWLLGEQPPHAEF